MCSYFKNLRSIYIESSSGESDRELGINIKMQEGRRTLCQLTVLERGKTSTIWWPWEFEGRWSVNALPPRGTSRMPPHCSATGKQSPQVTTRFLNGAENLHRRKHVCEVISQYLFISMLSFNLNSVILKSQSGNQCWFTTNSSSIRGREEKQEQRDKRCVSYSINIRAWWRIHLQCRRPRFDLWVGKIPWRRKWQPTPAFLPERIPWTEEPGGL